MPITEVEAYDGFNDKASHAHRGLTKRNFPMFGAAGRWYVYLIYGNYWMLNIVIGAKNYPSAILIRGASVVASFVIPAEAGIQDSGFLLEAGMTSPLVEGLHLNGPGKLTKFLKIDKRFNNKPANKKTGLWVESRPNVIAKISTLTRQSAKIYSSPRIGVAYAGPIWSKKPWRFYIKNFN